MQSETTPPTDLAQDTAMSDSDMGKKYAKGAVIGGLLGIPAPFVGPIIGALTGMGYMYYKHKMKG